MVFHLCHSGRPPSHPFRLLAFSPGPHLAFEDDLAAISVDNDLVCVYLSVAPEGFLNLTLNVGRFDARLDFDQVADAFDPCSRRTAVSAACCSYCHSTSPSSVTHPSLNDCLDLFIGNRKVVLDRSRGIARDVGIWPLVDAWYANLEIVRDCDNTSNALRCAFGLIFVSVAANKSRQRDSAITRR